MELYLKVRLACSEGMTQRQAAKHFNISRDTVRKMVAYSAPPGYRRRSPVRRPKLDAFVATIDHWLDEDQKVPRKQRHTAKRVGVAVVEFLAVVPAQRLRVDADQACDLGLGHAVSGQRLDLAPLVGIGAVCTSSPIGQSCLSTIIAPVPRKPATPVASQKTGASLARGVTSEMSRSAPGTQLSARKNL